MLPRAAVIEEEPEHWPEPVLARLDALESMQPHSPHSRLPASVRAAALKTPARVYARPLPRTRSRNREPRIRPARHPR